ncbi:hypothetical protein NMY22_g17910 [Coprinellus aureogranulatus]|nr:hypothetical protein NMY22_g17910 [Coprinellus aureogranulatus]
MIANAIMFANPTVKVYHSLPPPREDLEEVLAFIFMGSAKPTQEDFERSPMLVRRNQVAKALEWLKLNHADYGDLIISQKDLEAYPLSGVPVEVDFRKVPDGTDPTDKDPLEMSKHETDIEQGTTDGPCPFVVRGLTGPQYMNLSMKSMKAHALRHLETQGKMLGIGHEATPQSMYHNPQAYPQMFPWLFPYGLGGIGQLRHAKIMSEREHKRRLLLYHDKRFQTDLYFPMIAFNHEQMKSNVTGSFLFAKRKDFETVSSRIAQINPNVLTSVAEKMKDGGTFKPVTEDEKACNALLDDIDHVGAFSDGFLTSKKRMRNEIWALIAAKGAPNWFITFSPTDNRHPLCLYFADQDIKFSPTLRESKERDQLILTNPVAAARFFHTLVSLVIKHVLGFESELGTGLYGDPSAYYGTVEQQGRLTLHLHLMLWIKNSLSPQEIRDRLTSKDGAFQKALIDYLESAFKGEFATGSMEQVKAEVNAKVASNPSGHPEGYLDPTMTLPSPPPTQICSHTDSADPDCPHCRNLSTWMRHLREETDDILLRSNVHSCRVQRKLNDNDIKASTKGGDLTMQSLAKGCLDKDGVCASRFPRDIVTETTIDEDDGHILMKKLEEWVNTFTPDLSYLLRCNTDVTSLLSGTSIKAIVAYVTDYITKVSLKSHQIFSAAYDMYERNAEALFEGDVHDGARKMLLKICNNLSAKMELGSPMASMYLLGNPDHYTSHKFVPFFWRRYVARVKADWPEPTEPHSKSTSEVDSIEDEPVLLSIKDGELQGKSAVDDYAMRPNIYTNVSLYDWVQYSVKRKIPRKRSAKAEEAIIDDDLHSDIDGEYADDPSADETEEVGNGIYSRFQSAHPQHKSHEVKCILQSDTGSIPNFLGGSLPRKTQGDHEYYCMTMLCLFKPWRTGKDLKSGTQLWSDAFYAEQFSPFFMAVMKNMNLRYE